MKCIREYKEISANNKTKILTCHFKEQSNVYMTSLSFFSFICISFVECPSTIEQIRNGSGYSCYLFFGYIRTNTKTNIFKYLQLPLCICEYTSHIGFLIFQFKLTHTHIYSHSEKQQLYLLTCLLLAYTHISRMLNTVQF